VSENFFNSFLIMAEFKREGGDLDAIEIKEASGREYHYPRWMNYVGPGTNMERRLKLQKPAIKGTGSATYFFPVNLDDMVAFEHDLFYASDKTYMRDFADAVFLSYNQKGRRWFFNRLKRLGIKFPEKFKKEISKGEKLSTAAIYAKYVSRLSTLLKRKQFSEYEEFVSAVQKTADVMYKMMGKYGEFDEQGNYHMTKYNEKEFKQDLEELYRKFNKMNDIQYEIEGTRGYPNLPEVPAKEDLDNFKKRVEKIIPYDISDKQLVPSDYYKMSEQKRTAPLGIKSMLGHIRKEDEDFKRAMVNKYRDELRKRRLPVAPDAELNKIDSLDEQYDMLTKYAFDNSKYKNENTYMAIDDAENTIDDQVMEFLATKVSAQKFIGLKKEEAAENQRVEANAKMLTGKKGPATALYEGTRRVESVPLTSEELEKRIEALAPGRGKPVPPSEIQEAEGEVIVEPGPSGEVMAKSPRRKKKPIEGKAVQLVETKKSNVQVLRDEGIITEEEYKAYKQREAERKAGVDSKEDVKAKHRHVDNLRKQLSTKGLDKLKAELRAAGKLGRPEEAKTPVEATTPDDPEAVELEEGGAEGKVPVEEEEEALVGGKAAKVGKAAVAAGAPMPRAVAVEPVVLPKPQKEPTGTIPEAEQRAVVEAYQEQRGSIASKPEGQAPDNLVETAVNPIDRIVDKLMKKSSKEEREEMKALMAFITPSDQMGGIGTAKTNPLVRDNVKHEKEVVVGPGNLYKDTIKNHLLANTSNLAMLQQFSKPDVDAEMMRMRDAPRNRASLERVVPDVLSTQVQSKAESRAFIDSVNPSSAYVYGSPYDSYFQPVGRAGSYINDHDLSVYWSNPNTAFTPVRYQNP